MAEHSVGTIFVELDLDPSRYMKGQQKLLKSATAACITGYAGALLPLSPCGRTVRI